MADENKFSKLWDNDFSRALQSLNDKAEEALPNYYTDKELDSPWWHNVATGNFIGDKFIKNIGFTVGAFYSGNVTSSLLKVTKLPTLIGALTKSSRMPKMITSGVGATISALNEGRIEALNNSNEWFDYEKQILDDKFNEKYEGLKSLENTEAYEILKNQIDKDYEDSLNNLADNSIKMGNLDLMMNMPILLTSNLVQFGKLYANGFKTQRRTNSILMKEGKYISGTTKSKILRRAMLNPLSEGMEEISQEAASNISGLYYGDKFHNFYASKIDPSAEEVTVDFMKSFASGLNETLNDGNAWEQFFIGALTGAMGMPMFRGVRNAQGKFQSPVTLEGGIVGEYKEGMEQMEREQRMADYMNDRINSPEFLNYYQGMIRHNKYQKDMDDAVENDDAFEFKNAEHSQFISNIMMFDNAGKLDDLLAMIGEAYDLSDENLQSIAENTTSEVEGEDGKTYKVGPFVDKNGTPMYTTPEGKQEMQDKLTKTKEGIEQQVKDYLKIRDQIDAYTSQMLTDDQLEELVWLKSKLKDWEGRSKSLSSEIKPFLSNMSGMLSQLASSFTYLKNEEGQLHSGLSQGYLQADTGERVLNHTIKLIKGLLSYDGMGLGNMLANNPKFLADLKVQAENNYLGLQIDEVKDAFSKIEDFIKMVNAYNSYNDKLTRYYAEANNIQLDIDEAVNQTAQEENQKKAQDIADDLSKAKTYQDFDSAMNKDGVDKEITNKLLEDMIKAGNKDAANYKEKSDYAKKIRDDLNKKADSTDAETMEDAHSLLNNALNNSENLSDLANPLSDNFSDPSIIYDENQSVDENDAKYFSAQLAILDAIYDVNGSEKYKDSFPDTYLKSEEIVADIENAPREETTGDSQTPTIPPIVPGVKEASPTKDNPVPISDISEVELQFENKKAAIDTEESNPKVDVSASNRPYYRPAIPELHIEGVKEGDYRPFNEVAKEKNSNHNFDKIYEYLETKGAFKYVNEGHLKVGAEIKFMIDPEFSSTTIFMIDAKSGQIVGSLDESQYSSSRYKGLPALQKRILDKFNNRSNKEGQFVSSESTKVNKIMIGKIPMGTQERNLKDIPNASNKPIFGIIKNGVLSTNGVLDNNQILSPRDMSNKEGRMYILIPNGAGSYSPMAVRVKHFNTKEFNKSSVEIKNTPLFKNIVEAFSNMADSYTEEDVSNAFSDLGKSLYLGEMHIDFVQGNSGRGIRFTRAIKDANGEEIYDEVNGERRRREESKVVYLDQVYYPENNSNIEVAEPEIVPRTIDDIVDDMIDKVSDFNLSLQVNLGMLNTSEYNEMLLNSNVLTSNIAEARNKSNWFTTHPLDEKGEILDAESPKYVAPTPTDNGIVKGTKVESTKEEYHVDLTTNTIRDTNGRDITNTMEANERSLLLETAWADSTFGVLKNSSLMIDNVVLTPSGKVLDRNTQKYLQGEKRNKFLKELQAHKANLADADRVIEEIDANQKRVDKTKTDSKSYYILEEDGKYHPYDRVHTRLGSNWITSPEQQKKIDIVESNINKNVNNKEYLLSLKDTYNITHPDFAQAVEEGDINRLKSMVRDAILKVNSLKALDAGTAVDGIIRDFFNGNKSPKRPKELSEAAYNQLLESLAKIDANLQANGETFLTNNIVLFHKYNDGTRIAGEVDILAVDAKGNFKIYDVKTSKYSFYDFTNRNGHTVNYFENKSNSQNMSQRDYYTEQVSAYKNLFEAQYNASVTNLAILPFVMEYEGNTVSSITMQKGIPLKYNPNVKAKVPTSTAVVQKTSTKEESIFNTLLETHNPVEVLTPNHKMAEGDVGYYETDGKLYKGFLKKIGEVNGLSIFMTKVPTMSQGIGKSDAFVGHNTFLAVFPNGKTFAVMKKVNPNTSETSIAETIMKVLNDAPTKVAEMASEKTLVTQEAVEEVKTEEVITPQEELTPANVHKEDTGGALETAMKETAVNEIEDEFEDDLVLRKVEEDSSLPIWDKEKEIAWLEKNLPQFTSEERLQIVEGLIQAVSKGAVAWGQFKDGVITLSDIAAEGTLYHEAFHAVFDLLTDANHKQELLSEAREKWSNKTDIQLEELMAEDFREYVMTQNVTGLGNKIIRFFKNLYSKVKNWGEVSHSLDNYYRNINNGKYSASRYKVPTLSSLKQGVDSSLEFDNLNKDTRDALIAKGWTKEMWNRISPEERKQAEYCS